MNGFCSAVRTAGSCWRLAARLTHRHPTQFTILLLSAFSNSDSKHTRVLKEELFRGLPDTKLKPFF